MEWHFLFVWTPVICDRNFCTGIYSTRYISDNDLLDYNRLNEKNKKELNDDTYNRKNKLNLVISHLIRLCVSDDFVHFFLRSNVIFQLGESKIVW